MVETFPAHIEKGEHRKENGVLFFLVPTYTLSGDVNEKDGSAVVMCVAAGRRCTG